MMTPASACRFVVRHVSHLSRGVGVLLVCLVALVTLWTWWSVVFWGEERGRGLALALFHAALVPFVVSYLRSVRTDTRGSGAGERPLAPFSFSAEEFLAQQRVVGKKLKDAGEARQGAAEMREDGGRDREGQSQRRARRGGFEWGVDAEQDAIAEELIKRAERLKMWDVDGEGLPRYCDDCSLIKPDRSHHCSMCRACVLRFDHHCPWINNCVGLSNHKFFICFLFWTCCCVAVVGWYQYERAWGCVSHGSLRLHCHVRAAINYLFLVSFGLSCSLMLSLHLALAWMDKTTLEFLEDVFVRVLDAAEGRRSADRGAASRWMCGFGFFPPLRKAYHRA